MKNFIKENWFKLIAILLLLGTLANNPYSYYQFLRWVILIVAGYSAYKAYGIKENGWAWIFGIIAVLFNPLIPFYFSRSTWQVIDIIIAIIFFVSLFKPKKLEKIN